MQVTATDPNPGHTVTYSLDPGAPAGATINPSSGLFVWTPPNVQDDLLNPDPCHRQRT